MNVISILTAFAAYEWDFKATNPPVHAAAALAVFRNERERTGTADFNFLQRMLNKLLLNYAWCEPQGS